MKKSVFIIPVIIILVGILLSVYYENNTTSKTSSVSNSDQKILKISSSAFENEGTIPSEFTCDGQDISPPLSITNISRDTKTLSLIMTDPDAPGGNFTHWIVWNIPSSKTEFAKGEKFDFPQGRTGFGTSSYGGPCPPSGTHRYFIKIYALDTELDLAEGSSITDLQKAMDGHVITKSTLLGKYSRN